MTAYLHCIVVYCFIVNFGHVTKSIHQQRQSWIIILKKVMLENQPFRKVSHLPNKEFELQCGEYLSLNFHAPS